MSGTSPTPVVVAGDQSGPGRDQASATMGSRTAGELPVSARPPQAVPALVEPGVAVAAGDASRLLFQHPDSPAAAPIPAATGEPARRSAPQLLFRAHEAPPAASIGTRTCELPQRLPPAGAEQPAPCPTAAPPVDCGPAETSTARLTALRDYQREAVDAVVGGLTDGGRGQLRAACGSGKSLMALHACLRLCPAGLVVVACPSLALVAQTLHVWATAGVTAHVLAVCGDETMTDTAVRVADLHCPVSTNPTQIADWIRSTPSSRLRLVLVTHASAGVLGEGLLRADTSADLLVVDEAHHSAGAFDKHTALVHHDKYLPADRRLYMTATPRVLTARRRGRRSADDLLSMDDPTTFGPVLYTYPFARAIDDGWLDDYRVVVISVTSAEALRILRNLDPDAVVGTSHAPLLTAVVQTALIRAAAQFGLRRVLVFHSRIAQSKEFTRSLSATLSCVPDNDRPARPLTVGHVDGGHTAAQRQRHLNHLAEPPDAGWAVLSNARCLGEGVDVPAVDAVAFAAPKDSPPDVIQAVGRALRRHAAGSGVATVLVPVLLPDDPAEAAADIEADKSAWATLLQVLRALRAYDGTLAAELDAQRCQSNTSDATLPPRIQIQLPDGYATDDLLRQITVRVLEETTSNWLVGYTVLRDFHAEHGHHRIPVDHVSGGVKLARWVAAQRTAYRRGALSTEQIELLEAIGFTWAPQGDTWEKRYAALQRFHGRHGHLRIPVGYIVDGDDLYQWLRAQREQYRKGTLSEGKIQRLDALDIVWSPADDAWERAFAAAQCFHAEHGHLRVPRGYVDDDGIKINGWLYFQRRARKNGTLPDAKVRRLDTIGMPWDPNEESWERAFAAAQRFRAEHGHLRAPQEFIDDGIRIHDWLYTQRRARKNGTLPDAKVRRLDAIGIVWDSRAEAWEQGLTAAKEFYAEHGHLRVPDGHVSHGVKLKSWLITQRYWHKKGKVPTDRIAPLEAVGIIPKTRMTSEHPGCAKKAP